MRKPTAIHLFLPSYVLGSATVIRISKYGTQSLKQRWQNYYTSPSRLITKLYIYIYIISQNQDIQCIALNITTFLHKIRADRITGMYLLRGYCHRKSKYFQ